MNSTTGPDYRPAAENEQRERIRTLLHANANEAAALLATEIAALIRTRANIGRTAVLGLATGSTPVKLYRQLVRLHRNEALSFKNVVTFNLDEYYGLPPTHPESYARFMHEQLFGQVDLPRGQAHVPDGQVPRAGVFAWCRDYEEKIRAAGGIDLQVLGIGRTGHIGFNEPGASRDSRTRLVTLDSLTRRDAARDFLGESNVPRHAITMGVGTILEARAIRLLAWGEAKADIVAGAVEGSPIDTLPASLLQGHPAVTFHLDAAAASRLTRVRLPWLVGPVQWEPALTRRAVVWLSQKVRKPVLKLLDEDYSENGMADLLTAHGNAYQLNIRIFNELQHTITGWPAGKPGADDTHRPERAMPHPKRIVVFSPEPSDDVLGMGGTLRRLVDQGHEVTLAYQTSGNLAVSDEQAARAAEFVLELDPASPGDSGRIAETAHARLSAKNPFDRDPPEVRRLKAVLRRSEARAALQVCGLDPARARFLDLPFYEHGRYRQFRLGEEDVAATAALLREIRPHQIFATGRATDPSSVAAASFELLRRALTVTDGDAWRADCRAWVYRAPDRAWDAAEIDMAVPFSPEELGRKIQAIYQHQSQRTQSPALTAGLHEAWQQAEQHNRGLARCYDALGLADYEAIEAFQRWL